MKGKRKFCGSGSEINNKGRGDKKKRHVMNILSLRQASYAGIILT